MTDMELSTIKAPPQLTAAADREEFIARFGHVRSPEQHITEAFNAVQSVLDASLNYLLAAKDTDTWVDLATLDVADKCDLLRWAFGKVTGRDMDYHSRMQEHVVAIEFYNRERSRVLRTEYQQSGFLSLTEMANLADCMMTAAMQLDEGMACEHDDFHSAIFPRREKPAAKSVA